MLKDSIINELEKMGETPVSGQELAKRYSVSRNAVWKAINSLKAEGYDIVSYKNKGYYLKASSDVISAQGIRQYLHDTDIDIKCFSVIDSTNNQAKRLMAEGDFDTTLFVANTQSKGRGRQGREFYSPEDKGIYMTLLIKLGKEMKSTVLITMAAAVAVTRVLKSHTDQPVGIKWINDIFVNDRKAGGILTEASMDLESGKIDSIAVGIGLNVREQSFPEKLEGIATYATIENARRNQLIAEITVQLLDILSDMENISFMDEYRENLVVIGKKVQLADGSEALIKGVSDDGSLVVTLADGSEDCVTRGHVIMH